jgi:dihydroxyacid dehydratase/phosphogluconate dehydratase
LVPAGPPARGLSDADKAQVRQPAAQGLAARDALPAAGQAAYHAEGTCTFYGTANSNPLMLDLMGLQFPGGARVHPRAPEREALLAESVCAIVAAAGKRALAISRRVDARCIVNALVGRLASGGSTNHAMHRVAVARAAGWIVAWSDPDERSRAVVPIACIDPNGTADVNHFHAAGGTAAFGGDVVVVVRHQGPKANGMPEPHKLTPVLGVRLDRGQQVALVTDGRMSGASGKMPAAIHVTPEVNDGGALARLRDGDIVRVDAVAGNLSTAADLSGRHDAPAPAPGRRLGRGSFEAFRPSVSGAERGASVLFEG